MSNIYITVYNSKAAQEAAERAEIAAEKISGGEVVQYDDLEFVIASAPDGKFKRISKNALKAGLTIENGRMQSVDPGALPAGPAGQTRYMEVTAVGTWTYGGVEVGSNYEGYKTTFWWTGDSWENNGSVKISTPVEDGFTSNNPEVPGSAKNDKLLYDELNVGVAQEIPNGYSESTWDIPLSPGWSYYDTRCIVTDISGLGAINVVTNNSGSIKILAIGLDGFTIHSETKTAITGVDRFNFSNKTPLIDKSFYVGIEILEGGAMMKSSGSLLAVGTELWTETGIVNWRSVTYPLAYSIELVDGGVKGKIASLQIQVKSDTTSIQENLSKYGRITLDAKEFIIEDTIYVPSGATLDGVFGKSILKKGSSLIGDIINIENKEDVRISNIRFLGNQTTYSYGMNGINSGVGIISDFDEAIASTYQGVNNGINVNNSERVVLDSLQFHNLNGIGLKVEQVGKNYIHGMKSSKLFFYNCYKGIDASDEHEFSSYSDLMISLCQIGLDIASGNLNVANPIITRCRVGHILREGFNNAHGIFSNAEIKHHQLAGILIDNVTNGQLYSGLQMQYADLVIRNSKGIFIPDLFFTDGKIECSGGTGKNIIDNLFALGTPTINNTGNLTLNNNINWNI